MFDFDGDGRLGKSDIEKIIEYFGNPEEMNLPGIGLTKKEIQQVVDNVMKETDIKKTGFIDLMEFKHLSSLSLEFPESFRIKI